MNPIKSYLGYKKRIDYLAVAVLIWGIAIRAFHISLIPSGIHQDEALTAVDALALANYGTDKLGTTFPIHLYGWGNAQQSALLAYVMSLFVKQFGFNIVSVRMPLLILSSIGMFCVYELGKLMDKKLGLVMLSLTAICPWHFIQSRYGLDCNMFPHVFLIAFLILLLGIYKEKKWIIICSMFFFGLTTYAYGIADYSVPIFLLVFGIILLKNKKVTVKTFMACIVVFSFCVTPGISMYGYKCIWLWQGPAYRTTYDSVF